MHTAVVLHVYRTVVARANTVYTAREAMHRVVFGVVPGVVAWFSFVHILLRIPRRRIRERFV